MDQELTSTSSINLVAFNGVFGVTCPKTGKQRRMVIQQTIWTNNSVCYFEDNPGCQWTLSGFDVVFFAAKQLLAEEKY